MNQQTHGSYAQVNGLTMYYEMHGAGPPLVLLHGAFGTAEGWATVLPTSAETRQVIVVEQQGHGRTGDIARPLDVEQMAQDTAALLQQLQIETADVLGYSMGGRVALALAIRHPHRVQKLVIVGAGMGTSKDTYEPEAYNQFKSITPETFHFPQVKEPYTRVAPDLSQWPTLVAKIIQAGDAFKGFAERDVAAITAHTLIMLGDRDVIRPEHAVALWRLLPDAQLAIVPGSDHFLLFTQPEKALALLLPFLDAPAPEGGRAG